MKKKICLFFAIGWLGSTRAQVIDTMIGIGSSRLHFTIIKGNGLPIIFEAGGGDDASVWTSIIKPIAAITQGTIITYDRPGFGKSGLDTNRHGIIHGVEALEDALRQLGYAENCMLVAHSQGSLTATLFASRNLARVKSAVLIDASTVCWFNQQRLSTLQQTNDIDKIKIKDSKPGQYYQMSDLTANVNTTSQHPFPVSIPVIDLVSEQPIFATKLENDDWQRCHQEFVGTASNRTGILALGSGHYIFKDNPALVINVITKAYAELVSSEERMVVLQRGIDYAIFAANKTRQETAAYMHSETDLNSWGYQLLQHGELRKALEVFKLNVSLNPASANVYDSYGEALLKNGQNEEAIINYKKSLQLNPGNTNAKEQLKNLEKR